MFHWTPDTQKGSDRTPNLQGWTAMDGQPLNDLSVYIEYLSRNVPEFTLIKPGTIGPDESFDGTGKASSATGHVPSELPGADLLVDLCLKAESCRACDLSTTRNKVVFGEGSGRSGLMFVGEGPGADEDRTGRPFVGRAGELLTRMIVAMGLRREDVYIANTVKCRPPGNRVPTPAERASCFPFLKEQIRILEPRFMILLGQTAAQSLLPDQESISRIRGTECRIAEFPDIRVLPTYHPAYLLRNPDAKKVVWKDLQVVMGWMNLPVETGARKS